MSAMADMSRAMRLQIQERSTNGTLQGLSDEVLQEHALIVGAFHADLKEELARRRERETQA